MKNWKKLAALLLAGVMALAMLTACGDSGVEMYQDTGSRIAVASAIDEKSDGQFKTNASLNNIAWKALTQYGKKDGSVTWLGNHGVTTVDGKTVYINVATIGSANKGDDSVSVDNVTTIDSSRLVTWMEAHGLFKETNFTFENNWVNVGFATGKKDGKIYIAIVFGVNWGK